MKKNVLLSLALAIVVFACNNNKTETTTTTGFVIFSTIRFTLNMAMDDPMDVPPNLSTFMIIKNEEISK